MIKRNCILLIIVVIFLTACNKDINYDKWKDTIESYGDGTYQMVHQIVDNKSVEVLTNCKYNQCVITDIKKHIKIDDYVYFVGNYHNKKVFCKLDTANNMLFYFAEDNGEELIMVYINKMLEDKQIEIYGSLDGFLKEDRAIFDSMN